MKNIRKSVTDELIEKNKYLYTALDQANEIIKILEEENLRLKNITINLASINDEDQIVESNNEIYAI
jgi:hypothetical protein